MGEGKSKAVVSQRSGRGRGYHSIQRKLAWWTVALSVVPTLVCTLLTSQIARESLQRQLTEQVMRVGQRTADSLEGKLGKGWTAETARSLDWLVTERRVSFVVVTDAKGSPLFRRVMDRQAWEMYEAAGGRVRVDDKTRVGEMTSLGSQGEMAVWPIVLWAPGTGNSAGSTMGTLHRSFPAAPIGGTPTGGGSSAQVDGYVIVAVRDPSLPATLDRLLLWQSIGAGIICVLSVAVVWWAVRRWSKPIRQLASAAAYLGRCRKIEPVAVVSRDEMGMLAEAFNDMAGRLLEAHGDLERANRELELKVKERTAELERLNARLEGEMTEKNTFLRIVSHDLGAPLRNIAGMTAMLMMKHAEKLEDDAVTKLKRIDANVKAQVEMIEELMELSRLKARRGKKERVDLTEMMKEIEGHLAYDLEHAKVTLEVRGALPVVWGERSRLRQVLLNLVDNAVKYMGDGDVRKVMVGSGVEASGIAAMERWRVGEESHLIWVRDTGRGITPDDLPHIFEVFRRGRGEAVHRIAGRGLGLAGVKAIVETYGGRIWAESEMGRGSTFYLTLDRALTREEAGETVTTQEFKEK